MVICVLNLILVQTWRLKRNRSLARRNFDDMTYYGDVSPRVVALLSLPCILKAARNSPGAEYGHDAPLQ